MKKITLILLSLSLSSLSFSQTPDYTLSGNIPLHFTSIGTGSYDRSVVYHSNTYGFLLQLARTTNLISADPLDFSISARGGGYSPFFIQGSSGYVGIGMTSPSSKLHVSDGNQTIRFLTGTSTSAYQLDLGVNDDGVNFHNNSNGRGYKFSNNAGDLFRISHNGDIGIGTTPPSSRLHVSDGNQTVRFLTGTSTSAYQLDLGVNDDGVNFHNNSNGRGYNFSNNARDLFSILANGSIGIGKTNPNAKLDISGMAADWSETTQGTGVGSIHLDPGSGVNGFGSAITFGAASYAAGENAQAGIYTKTHSQYGTKMYFSTTDSYSTGSKTRLMINSDGNIGIGTTSPNEKLSVDGTVLAKKMRVSVQAADWSDYVFNSNYELRPLDQIEAFIQKNHHLPEVPSAKEVEANGLDLGNMDATLLKKVEELTLYMIEMNKTVKAQDERIKQLEKENKALKNQEK